MENVKLQDEIIVYIEIKSSSSSCCAGWVRYYYPLARGFQSRLKQNLKFYQYLFFFLK